MSNLSEQIAAYEVEKAKRVPKDILGIMDETTAELKSTGIEGDAVKSGDIAPDFTLPNHNGEERSLATMLKESALVVSFYRGGWCPYCNLELAALQRALPEIEGLGAKLVAVSPETPDKSLSTREKNELAFDVLYDKGNSIAESYGLVFTLSEKLRPIYDKFGIDVPGYNGDETFRLPLPATFVIGKDGTVLFDFVDADYTKRLEPDAIIAALKKV